MRAAIGAYHPPKSVRAAADCNSQAEDRPTKKNIYVQTRKKYAWQVYFTAKQWCVPCEE